MHCGDQRHLGLCLGYVPALAYGSCRVSDQGTTLRASDLHNARSTILNPFNSDVIMSTMASQITGILIVCWTVCSGADQRKHQSSTSLAFVVGYHRSPVDSPHKGPVTQKMYPFDDIIMICKTQTCSSLFLQMSCHLTLLGHQQLQCWASIH